MIIFPAIDLYGGSVVRLTKGDFSKMTVYNRDPLDLVKQFQDAGCTHLHIVDLEGAHRGMPKHLNVLSRIAGLGMYVQYGGGLRSRRAITDALDAGVNRAMVGSLLFSRDRYVAQDIFNTFGLGVMPSIDVKEGHVAHSGWLEMTDETPEACLGCLVSIGYRTFLVTSTERDGLMEGPNLELYAPLLSATAGIVAAGGISTVKDVEDLRDMGLAGAVIGKAFYEGGIDLARAVEAAGSQICS